MYTERPRDQQIDRYSGPYERWVFSEELGKPYAFPAIAQNLSSFYTAILEGEGSPASIPGVEAVIPPLWNPSGRALPVTPFAFHDGTANDPRRNVQQDTEIATLLGKSVSGLQSPDGLGPRARVNFPIAQESWCYDYDSSLTLSGWQPPADTPKAIIAVIDDAIPFAHQAFVASNGETRMSHCWLQSARAEIGPCGIPFGREWTNAQIDQAISDAQGDEARLYRDTRAVESRLDELGTHLRRHTTHGAHVAGIAAGNSWRYRDISLGDDVAIIAVQLPNTIAWDTSGFGKEMYMLSAIHYIMNRANAIANHYGVPELPLVINFSYGWSAGRHDGKSAMEQAIQDLLEQRKEVQPATALAMPTGNNFDMQMHGQFTGDDMRGGSYTFGWQVLPDDHTSSYLELWLPEGFDPAGYRLTVKPPNNSGIPAHHINIAPDPALTGGDPRRFIEIEQDGQNIGQLSVDLNRCNRWRAMIALIPTVYTRGTSRRAPAGRWTIQLDSCDGVALQSGQAVNVWIQRDDDPTDLKSMGQQSYLVDPTGSKAPFGFIRGYGTLNAVASSPLTTRVAGYVETTQKPAQFSAAGGLLQVGDNVPVPWGQQTDVSAPSCLAPSLPWAPSIGTLSGSSARMIGTSTAAPLVARLMVANAAENQDMQNGFDKWDFSGLDETDQIMNFARLGQNKCGINGVF